MSFQNVFTHGNLVDVNVRVWTAERRLQKEDLGIEDNEISEAFTLGHKKLVPPDVIAKFRHLDYLARATLYRYSFHFEFGSARFVPKKAFIKFAQEMDKVVDDFNDEANKFALNYDRYRLEMRQHYLKAANEAYIRKSALCGGLKESQENFVKRFLERVDKYYPSAEEIRTKFSMDYVVFQMALPDLSQASYEDLAEESEKIRMMQDAYQMALTNKVRAFVDKIVDELRGKATTVLQQVANSIQQGKKITEPTLRMIRKMIAEYKDMNVVGDAAFEKVLVEFKTRVLDVYNAKQIRNDDALRQNLYKELKGLVELASDRAAITGLADNYRRQLSL